MGAANDGRGGERDAAESGTTAVASRPPTASLPVFVFTDETSPQFAQALRRALLRLPGVGGVTFEWELPQGMAWPGDRVFNFLLAGRIALALAARGVYVNINSKFHCARWLSTGPSLARPLSSVASPRSLPWSVTLTFAHGLRGSDRASLSKHRLQCHRHRRDLRRPRGACLLLLPAQQRDVSADGSCRWGRPYLRPRLLLRRRGRGRRGAGGL